MRRLVLLVFVACTHEARPAAPRGVGDTMLEVGIRFERAGRAVLANRWPLARYEVGELDEMFEEDLVGATWKGNPAVARLARAFGTNALGPLRDAIVARDQTSSAEAFAGVARACNACHRAAHVAYIEVPTALGTSVPVLDQDTVTPGAGARKATDK